MLAGVLGCNCDIVAIPFEKGSNGTIPLIVVFELPFGIKVISETHPRLWW